MKADGQNHDLLPHGGENLEVMAEADNYNEYLRQLVRRFSGSPASAVDFGAGIGTFSDSLQLPKQQVHCIESEATSRAEIERRGFHAHASLSELESASMPYAFTLNVLEHIADDAAALRELYRVLQPQARLFVYVPAFQILFTSMDAHVGHHRRYRRRALLRLVEDAGFQVEQSAYTDALGFFATLVFKLFDKSEPAPLSPRLVRFYDRFVFPLSRMLSVPLAKILGKNAYVVARKPGMGR